MAAGWTFFAAVLFLDLNLLISCQLSTANNATKITPTKSSVSNIIREKQDPLIIEGNSSTLQVISLLTPREMKHELGISHFRRTRSADLNLFSRELDGLDDMENLQNVMTAATYESRKISSIRPDQDRKSPPIDSSKTSVPIEKIYYEVPRKHSAKLRTIIRKQENMDSVKDNRDIPGSRIDSSRYSSKKSSENQLTNIPIKTKYNQLYFQEKQTEKTNNLANTQNHTGFPTPIRRAFEPDITSTKSLNTNYINDLVTIASKRKKPTDDDKRHVSTELPQISGYHLGLLKKYDVMPRPFSSRNSIKSFENDLLLTPVPSFSTEPIRKYLLKMPKSISTSTLSSVMPTDSLQKRKQRPNTAESKVDFKSQPMAYQPKEQIILNVEQNPFGSVLSNVDTGKISIPSVRKLRGRTKFDQDATSARVAYPIHTQTPLPLEQNKIQISSRIQNAEDHEKPDNEDKMILKTAENIVEFTGKQYPRKYHEIKRPRKYNNIEDIKEDKESSDPIPPKSVSNNDNPVPRADYEYDYGQHPVQRRIIVVQDDDTDYVEKDSDDLAPEGDEQHEQKHDEDHEKKAVDKKHEEGAGEEEEEGKHDEHGEKLDEGYKSWHEHDKHEKGHHDKEEHSKHYDEKEGQEKEHEDEGGYHEHHAFGEHGEKKADFGEKGKHEKGHSTKGEHVIHKKDEYEKKTEFFDEFHDDGEMEKDGAYHEEHEQKKGGHHKSGHHHEEADEEKHGKAGKYEKGHHHHEKKGHDVGEGHDRHHHHQEKFGKKGEHEEKKQWSHKKGDAGGKEGA